MISVRLPFWLRTVGLVASRPAKSAIAGLLPIERFGRRLVTGLGACFSLLFGMVLFVPAAGALEQVSVQLKWKHQFQFAGHYAAVEKGFYRESGLDVEVREGDPDIDAMKAVEEGAADFGVCTTSALLEKRDGFTSA
jgi:hypothetical protein